MDFFSDALRRLKHELRVSLDGEVARALGMTATAFSERKKRSSFPQKELVRLVEEQSDLGVDLAYVLTGVRSATHASLGALGVATQLAARLDGSLEERGAAAAALHQAMSSGGLTAEEQTLVQYFRAAPKDVQRAVMGALLGLAPTPGAGSQHNSGAHAVQVGQAGGAVKVKTKGR